MAKLSRLVQMQRLETEAHFKAEEIVQILKSVPDIAGRKAFLTRIKERLNQILPPLDDYGVLSDMR